MPLIESKKIITKDDIPVTGNGRYDLYVSGSFPSNNNNSLEADLIIHSLTPNRNIFPEEGEYGKATVNLILERETSGGSFAPIHSLYTPIRAVEIGVDKNGGIIPNNQLTYGKNVFNFDGAVPIAASDGDNIIFLDHQKRGIMPDKFRFKLILIEKEFGTVKAFDRIEFSLDYELKAE